MATTIRLNKQNKTIKVVYRRENIKLANPAERISLKHTGKTGPQGEQGEKGDKGDQGDTGVSTFVRVHHGADDSVARPSALYVEWVGTATPSNATEEDTWIDTN